jgi:hypothetical protein
MTPISSPLLSPYSLTTEEELFTYFGATSKEENRPKIVRCCNEALARLEHRLRRRLAVRTYRNTTTLTCTLTNNVATITGSGFLALKVLDDVVAPSGIQAGTRLLSVQSDSAATLSLPATAAGATALTFGSAPLEADRLDAHTVHIPEYPVQALYSCGWMDDSGLFTSLSTTGARLEKRTGELFLPNDFFPEIGRVVMECKAGFVPPTGAQLGDPEWFDLQQLLHRWAGYLFADQTQNRGRVTNATIGPLNSSVDMTLPKDIADELWRYGRRW